MRLFQQLLIGKNPMYFNLFASLGVLFFVYSSQYLMDLIPCTLCHYQRIPYFAIIVLSFFYFYLKLHRYGIAIFLLIFMIQLINLGVASYHSGVELGFFQGTGNCTANLTGSTIDSLREQIYNNPIASCQAAWKLFGISASILHACFIVAWLLYLAFVIKYCFKEQQHGISRKNSRR